MDANNEKPGRSDEAGSFAIIILIIFIIGILYAIALVMINKYSVENKKSAAVMPVREQVSIEMAQEILDTIEDYYIVNKLDKRTVKVLRLEKIKIDTITIKEHVSSKNR